MASPESENQLLRSVLTKVAEGKADAAAITFALSDSDAAVQAFEAYQARQDRVIDQVREFLAGDSDDTTALAKAFDQLIEMHGVRSGDRAATRGPGKGRRRRRS